MQGQKFEGFFMIIFTTSNLPRTKSLISSNNWHTYTKPFVEYFSTATESMQTEVHLEKYIISFLLFRYTVSSACMSRNLQKILYASPLPTLRTATVSKHVLNPELIAQYILILHLKVRANFPQRVCSQDYFYWQSSVSAEMRHHHRPRPFLYSYIPWPKYALISRLEFFLVACLSSDKYKCVCRV
jgi:hypothetical protein